MLTEGNNLRMMIDKAAQNDDLDMLRRLQSAEFTDDEALIRHEKARAKMWNWPSVACGLKPLKKPRRCLLNLAGTTMNRVFCWPFPTLPAVVWTLPVSPFRSRTTRGLRRARADFLPV